MATRKFRGRFSNPNSRDRSLAHRSDTSVWTVKITGMTANSVSFSAVNWDASLVKTVQKARHRQPLASLKQRAVERCKSSVEQTYSDMA
jgi:hypothetical protein